MRQFNFCIHRKPYFDDESEISREGRDCALNKHFHEEKNSQWSDKLVLICSANTCRLGAFQYQCPSFYTWTH